MKVGLAIPREETQRAVNRALTGGEHEVAFCVSSGAEALKRVSQEAPDVLLVSASLMDLSAAELTRRVLERSTTAVVIVGDDGQDKVSAVYEAMGAGALDVVKVPLPNTEGPASTQAFIAKLRTIGRFLGRSSGKVQKVESGALAPASERALPLIAIGASTGGPQALLTILTRLPKNIRAAIVIVQHVDSEFSEGLASWLQAGSGIPVELARPGASPRAGSAVLAGTNDHLVMTAGETFRYVAEPRALPYRPSVDVFFSSLAEHWRRRAAAVLLTGMGKDGAQGLLKLRQAGWHTIAQDEASSVVYGMPKAAAQLGAACKILPLEGIAHELAEFVSGRSP